MARAKVAIENEIIESVNELSKTIGLKLQGTILVDEWEPVLCYALTLLMQNIEVMHTGGPSEQGADIEIRIPNPFTLNKKQDVDDYPFIVVIQVKDYVGTIGVEVSVQLKRAIESRKDQGQVIAAYILYTNARPSEELVQTLRNISLEKNILLECVSTDVFMKIIAKGFLINSAH